MEFVEAAGVAVAGFSLVVMPPISTHAARARLEATIAKIKYLRNLPAFTRVQIDKKIAVVNTAGIKRFRRANQGTVLKKSGWDLLNG